MILQTSHIRFFVQQVETVYNKRFFSVTTGQIRPVAMFVVYRFSGNMSDAKIARMFNCRRENLYHTVRRQSNYYETNNDKFMYLYNKLLILFIKTSKIYLNDHTKRKLVS